MAKRAQARSFDAVTLAEAFRRPGADTRQWISYGKVDSRTENDGEVDEPVEFDSEYGPLVNVTLQPSNIPVRCRVAIPSTGACGDGESEYSPFIPGDEVLVAIPEGDETAGPAIIGRLNNALDKFPAESVAGQDPTGNKFAFQRRRTPFVQEWASTYMVRVASHGGFLLISESGVVTLRDGSGGALQMGPDIFGYSEGARVLTDPSADPQPPTPPVKALLQLDLTGRRFTVQVDDAMFMLNSTDADSQPGQAFLAVPAQLTVALGTNQPFEHVATTEFVLAALETFALALAGPAGAPVALAALAAVLASGGVAMGPTLSAALASGLPVAATIPKPPAVGGLQMAPTLGATFFITG